MDNNTNIFDTLHKTWPLLCVMLPFLFDLQIKQVREHVAHRRNLNDTICILVLGFLIFLVEEYFKVGAVFSAVLFLYFLLIILYLFSIRSKCNFFSDPILFYLSCEYEKGNIAKYEHFFEREKHFFFIGKALKIEYLFLKEKYLGFRLRFKECIQILEQISEQDLYTDELDYLQGKKAIALMMLGCNSSAWLLLNLQKHSQDPLQLCVASCLYEQEGNVAKAREVIVAAKNFAVSRNIGAMSRAQVLADYSRFMLQFETPLEALQNIMPAYKMVSKGGNNKYYRLISGNYIKILQAYGSQDEEIKYVLEKLNSNIPKDDLDGQIELLNLRIQFFFARGMHQEAYSEICTAFEWQKSSFSAQALPFIKVSIFMILVNSHLCMDPFRMDFEGEFERISSLKKIDKVEICDRYFSIFEDPLFCSIRVCPPFNSLYQSICQYYKSEALQDIEEIKHDLDVYEVIQQQNVFRYEMHIRRYLDGRVFIQKNLKSYLDFIGILDKNSRPVDALYLCFDLLREINSPHNLQFLVNGEIQDWSTFFNSYLILPPTKTSDGIHEEYPCVPMEGWLSNMLPPNNTLLSGMVFNIENRVKTLKSGHKCFIGKYALYVAHAYMCLEDFHKGLEWFKLFKSFNIPLGLLNYWEQKECRKLDEEFLKLLENEHLNNIKSHNI